MSGSASRRHGFLIYKRGIVLLNSGDYCGGKNQIIYAIGSEEYVALKKLLINISFSLSAPLILLNIP